MGDIIKKSKKTGILIFVIGWTIFSIGILIYSILARYGAEEKLEMEAPELRPEEELIEEASQPVAEEVETGQEIIASNQSDKYHKASCRHAKNIAEENIIHFATREDAQSKGYKPCGVCQEV